MIVRRKVGRCDGCEDARKPCWDCIFDSRPPYECIGCHLKALGIRPPRMDQPCTCAADAVPVDASAPPVDA